MLQVLLQEFTLTKEPEGLLLELNIHDCLSSLIDSAGKRAVFRAMAASGTKARAKLKAELREFFEDPRLRSVRFQTSGCPLRYGNGGALPVIRIGSTTYFCLFYRDAFPIGWNLANGASDSLAEMGDPELIVHREFGEELLIVDHGEQCLYTFDVEPGKGPRGVQAVSLREWTKRRPDQPLDRYQHRPIPLKWFPGPDRVLAHIRSHTHTSGGYFVNITPEDNAIECDRVALIHLNGKPVFFDGELIGRRHLNRPVGLFEVKRFEGKLGSHCFRPDRLFHDLEEQDPSRIEAVVARYRAAVPEQSRENVHAYRQAASRHGEFDLCPITRAMIGRYQEWIQRQSAPPEKVVTPAHRLPRAQDCDIFISCRSADQAIAQWLHQFLEKRGHQGRVFCSSESLPRLGESDYASAIDAALEFATCMIVVGTQPEHFDSGWVGYEWRSFLNEVRSGRKAKGQVFVFSGGVEVGQLPLSLRSQQMVPYSAASPHDSFEALYRFIETAVQPRQNRCCG